MALSRSAIRFRESNNMNETEAQTRARFIDTKLALAGWNVKDRSQVIEELEIHLKSDGTRESTRPSFYADKRFSDYGLLLHGKPAAVLEAKRTSRDAEVGQEQALQYAQQLRDHHDVELPLVFYSNGHKHFFWDSDNYPPEEIGGFPTRLDLEWMRQRNAQKRPLAVELINRDIAGRDYQIQGIRTILEALEEKRRKFLMVMATGTGKTRTAIALVDVLRRARWSKRGSCFLSTGLLCVIKPSTPSRSTSQPSLDGRKRATKGSQPIDVSTSLPTRPCST